MVFSPLRVFATALANRHFKRVNVLFLGDSILEGYGASTLENRAVARFRDLLRTRFPSAGIPGGQGYVKANYAGTSFDSEWFYAGNATHDGSLTWGLGHESVGLPDGAWMYRGVDGTSLDVSYLRWPSGGTITVTSNDVEVGSVDTAGDYTDAAGKVTGPGQVLHVTLPETPATVKIQVSGGSGTVIEGVTVFDGDEEAGITVYDAARTSSTLADWLATADARDSQKASIAAVQPALVVLALGANDILAGRAVADIRADLETVLGDVRAACTVGPDFVYVVPNLDTTNPHYAQRAAMIATLEDLASTDTQFHVFDLGAWVAPVDEDTLGLYFDGLHVGDQGQSLMADLLVAAVTPQGALLA